MHCDYYFAFYKFSKKYPKQFYKFSSLQKWKLHMDRVKRIWYL